MTDYIEEYDIAGKLYGIEDLHSKKDRFMLWAGGCGFGRAQDIHEARSKVHEHARKRIVAEICGMKDDLRSAESDMKKLGDDPFFLSRFSTECIKEGPSHAE